MRVIKQQPKQNYFETKEIHNNTKNKKIREYSKPNLLSVEVIKKQLDENKTK